MSGYTLSDLFKSVNISNILIPCLAALGALFLNSQYVSNAVYAKEQEIILLKITNLEVEAQALRYSVNEAKNDFTAILPLVEKINSLISKLITPDGEIIITTGMAEIQREIAVIKRDIENIKAELKNRR